MEQILFKDVPSDDIYFMKNVKKWQITSIVFCVVFVILGTISFISEKDVGENRYLLLIAPMAGIALFVGIFIIFYLRKCSNCLIIFFFSKKFTGRFVFA